jgi:hypothetical protein
VADLVVGTYNGHKLFPSTAKPNVALISLSTTRVLSALAGKKRSTLDNISRVSGLSQPTVRKQLAILSRFGLLKVRDLGRVSITHEIRPPFKEILAFEVKMKDWRSGIYQARNYKSFAHKVAVVLPLGRAVLLKSRMLDFRRMRVGLVGVAPNGELKWLRKPHRQKPTSSPRNFLAAVRLMRKMHKKTLTLRSR